MTEKAPRDDQPEGTGITLDVVGDAAEPKPGTLTLTAGAKGATLTLTGGTAIPATITVVDESGSPIARYVAGELAPVARGLGDSNLWYVPVSMFSGPETFGPMTTSDFRIDDGPGLK
ncbi:hypothetical protein [Nocardia sp. NPDC056000]|uniref:hypothetical protein n=1 Tax=Nocardia sp. NPDC056000 TaxID=3345674 RepID=UPI0035D7FCD3